MRRLPFRCFPCVMRDRAWELTVWELLEKGYCGVILDIDGTLAVQNREALPEAVAFVHALQEAGLKTCLISNNGEERVKPFAASVSSMYLCRAGKPRREAFERAMQKMETDAAHTLAIGDQLFTDVWGANRAGICSVLTRSLDRRAEVLSVKLKRPLEALLLMLCRRADCRELPEVKTDRYRSAGQYYTEENHHERLS